TTKLITKVVVAVSEIVSAAVVAPTVTIVSAAAVVPTVTAAPFKVIVPSTRRRKGIEEEANRAIESINETPVYKAAKRRKRNQEVKDVEEIKEHLEIVL
nr:hypothetical protein [Tanacetum cinerariifolium]